MNQLPVQWEMTRIGEVAENADARRVPLKQTDREHRDGPYPYYGASGIIDSINEYIYEGEHLLIAEDGANLLARSTPIAFRADGKFWVNNHAHVLMFNGKADLRYVERYLATIDLTPFVTGSAQPKLNRKNLERIPIPLPSLSEQKRIAGILDKADAIRRKRQQAIGLTEQFLRSTFLDMFGDPVMNEAGYPIKRMIEVVNAERPISYGILKPGPDIPGGIPYVRVVDIRDGTVLVDQVRRTTPKMAQEFRRSTIKPGDLLMSIRGHVGRMGFVPNGLAGGNITQDTARLAIEDKVLAAYVYWCLDTVFMQQFPANQKSAKNVGNTPASSDSFSRR